MKDNEFISDSLVNLESETIEMLHERLFGLPDRRKKEEAKSQVQNDPPTKQTSVSKSDISPEYIERMLKNIQNNTRKTIERFIETEYEKVVNMIKNQDPKAFKDYLLSLRGDDDEEEFKISFLSSLWQDVAKDHGVRVAPEKEEEGVVGDTKNKSPFYRVFEDGLFNKDNYPNVIDILNYKFREDRKELERNFHIYENLTSDKEIIARLGFSDRRVLSDIMARQLAILRLGYMLLRDDPRLEETYGTDPDNPKIKGGKQIVQQELQKLASQYSAFNEKANKLAMEEYNKLKSMPPKEFGIDTNPFDFAVEKWTREIGALIREARAKEAEKETEITKFQKATRANIASVERPLRDRPEDDEQEEVIQNKKDKQQTSSEEQNEQDEKRREEQFSKDPYQRRTMLGYYTAQQALSAVENPDKILNLDEDDFRSIKTIFAYNIPFGNDEQKEKFSNGILSSTKKEFASFLKNLSQNPKVLSQFVNLWNEDKDVGGKLSTHLLKGEYPNLESPNLESPSTRSEKEVETNVMPKTPPPSPPKQKDDINLSNSDLQDAGAKSSKGIRDYLKKFDKGSLGI